MTGGTTVLSTPPRRSLGSVDNRNEVRDFLMSRRAKLTPEQAGLPISGQRRVKGLRRSEVAMLATVSIEYYAKIERGNLAGVSDAISVNPAGVSSCECMMRFSSAGPDDEPKSANVLCVSSPPNTDL